MKEEELEQMQKRVEDAKAHAEQMANLEANLIYDLCNCIDILMFDVEHRYNMVNKALKQEKKQAFSRMVSLGRGIHHNAEMLCDKDMMEAYDGDWNCVDRRRERSNEYIRTLLMYIEKCGESDKNYYTVHQCMVDCEGGLGLVTQEDLERFDMNRKPNSEE